MIRCGLTGSIAAGKSTISRYFQALGFAVFDADLCVKTLYNKDRGLQKHLNRLFPGVVVENQVDRRKLTEFLIQKEGQQGSSEKTAIQKLEALVHPVVERERKAFLKLHQKKAFLLFDIPLLFETQVESCFEVIIVVTAPEKVRKQRVLSRKGMTQEKYQLITKQQMPDEEKREKADYLIETGIGFTSSKTQVQAIYRHLQSSCSF